jgi:hypothetical protein
MRRWASWAALSFAWILGTALAAAQDFSVYPDLIVLAEKDGADLGCEPSPEARSLEVLSPVLPRGGHLTLVLVVRAKSGSGFAIDVGLNPKDRTPLKLYRYFPGLRYANSFFAQPLEESPMPLRGRIGEGQRCAIFLLDVGANRDAPLERVKVEPAVWLEGAPDPSGWSRYPLEVRIAAERSPSDATLEECEAPLESVARSAYLGAERNCRPPALACKATIESTVGSLLARQFRADFPISPDWPACAAPESPEPLIPALIKARAKSARNR